MIRTTLAVAAVALVARGAGDAHAQSDDVVCLPEANGVPFTGGAAPDFWDSALPPTYVPEDDPGWVGATQTGHGFAASHAIVRGISNGGTELFLSFESLIPLDPAFPQAELWLGFDDGSNTRVYRIRVPHTTPTPLTSEPIRCLYDDPTNPSPPAHCTTSQNNSYRILTAATGSPPQFGSLDDLAQATVTTTWPFDTGRMWTRPGDNFAIFVRAALADLGVSVASGSVKFWYQLTLFDSGSTVQVPVAKWPPRTPEIPDANFSLSFGLTAPAVTDWGTLRVGDSDPSCRHGLFVDRTNVGIAQGSATAALTSRIVGQDAGVDVANFFVAKPESSDPAGTVPTSGLQARFRVADWGSSPPSSPGAWTSVHTLSGSPNEWVDINASGELISDPWTLTSAQRCDYDIPVAGVDDACAGTATKSHHQCILTEIRDNGASVAIKRDSVYRNTNFVNLSKFERIATIGAQGITADADLDYYLYVAARHMPGRYDRPTDPRAEVKARLEAIRDRINGRYQPPESVAGRLRAAANAGNDQARRRLEQLVAEAQSQMPARTKKRRDAVVAALGASDVLSAVAGLDTETVEEAMPSMIVYVFRDSGKKVSIDDGSEVRTFVSQGAFGYYAKHPGAIAGWRAVIDGARRIGNSNWYAIKVQPGGKKKINTRIQALQEKEAPIKPDPSWTPPKPDQGGDGHGQDNETEPDEDQPDKPIWKRPWFILLIIMLILGIIAFGTMSSRGGGRGDDDDDDDDDDDH